MCGETLDHSSVGMDLPLAWMEDAGRDCGCDEADEADEADEDDEADAARVRNVRMSESAGIS